jgi:hypothetical protein
MQNNYFLGIAKMYGPVDFNKEFAYWGEIGKWRNLMFVHWILVREVPFEMVSELKEDGTVIFNLKDGSNLSFNNARYLINYMLEHKEQNTIVNYFASLDKSEKKLRMKIDPQIKTGMIEMIKKDVDKKVEINKTN